MDFRKHLESVHVFRDIAHWKALSFGSSSGPIWDLSAKGAQSSVFGMLCLMKCLTCKLPLGTDDELKQHRDQQLRDLQDFYEHRERILQLCPEFGSHPVFDDIRPPVWRHSVRRA